MSKNKNGRPLEYDADLCNSICLDIAEGKSLRASCRERQVLPSTFLGWAFRTDLPLYERYARAREIRAEILADEIVEIADLAEDDNSSKVQKAKLQVDARRWVASKLLPKRYGDKLEEAEGAPKQPIQIMSKDDLLDLVKAVRGGK